MNDFEDLAALQGRIVSRAEADAGFRAALLADASGAIERELGIHLPLGLRLKVVEQEPETIVLVLPVRDARSRQRPAAQAPHILSNEDLDQIAAAGPGYAMPDVDIPGPLAPGLDTDPFCD